MKETIIVSACFLSDGYKYDGTNNINEKIIALKDRYDLIPVCPEVAGGLETPRLASEKKDNKVFMKDGKDVTSNFVLGAQKVLEIALLNNCKKAILKARSPSCGKDHIYDGTFSHTIIDGNGVLAQMLIDNGFEIYTEEEIEKL